VDVITSGRGNNVTNDIQNLLSRFGATSESYLEVDDFPEYREPPHMESPPPGVTGERPLQAEKNASVTHGHAS